MSVSRPGPTGVQIAYGSTTLNLPLKGYKFWSEAAIIRQPGLVGSDTPQKEARPEILTWKIDNASKGEGVERLNSADDISLRSYQTSDDAVDISIAGKFGNGYTTATSLAAAASTNLSGPHLALAAGNPWLIYEGAAFERTTSPDTWTDRAARVTYARAKGVDVVGSKLYVGDHNAPVTRMSSGAGVDYTAENGHSPHVNSGRLYSWNFNAGTGTLSLYQYDLSAAAGTAGVVVGTYAANLPSLSCVSNGASYGSNIFWVVQPDGDEARLLVYDGKNLTERKRLPRGFKLVDTSGVSHSIAVMNDFVWITGYYAGTSQDLLAVIWVSPDLESGTLIKSGASSGFRIGESLRGVSVSAVRDNELLIGTNVGKIFKYDMAQGSFSLFCDTGASAWQVYDSVYADGYYYFAMRNTSTQQVRVDRTNGYCIDTTMTWPVWDYDYPSQTKLLTEVEVQSEALPASCTITVSFTTDTGTITLDKNAATLVHSGTGDTTTTFQMGGNQFKWLQPIVLFTGPGGATRPVALSITMRAVSKTVVNYQQFDIDLKQSTAQNRPAPNQTTGALAIAQLKTLRDTGGVFTVKPYWQTGPKPHPDLAASAVSVVVSQNQAHNPPFYVDLDEQAGGVARLVVQEI